MRNMLQANMQLTILGESDKTSTNVWKGMFGVVVLLGASLTNIVFAFKVLYAVCHVILKPVRVIWHTHRLNHMANHVEPEQRKRLKHLVTMVLLKICAIAASALIFYTAFCVASIRFGILFFEVAYADA